MKTLDFNEKQNIAYCISTDLRDQQIKINCKKIKERVEPATEINNHKIAVVSFGPSLKDTWKELKKFDYIMTCSGSHKFLIEKGIIPTYHLELEPREHKIKMLGQPHKDTQYLIASTIHPKYLDALKGYNVKLWHIFATDEEAVRVLPKGEWALTGGSSVGLRTISMARFLGFKDIHIFGMDGNIRPEGSHTTEHPNAPTDSYKVEYGGKMYDTTPSMLFCAKETFKELDQLDIKFKFYGEGLVQAIAKDYVPNFKKGADLAYNSPELISQEYLELNSKLHQDNPNYGMGGSKYVDTVLKLSEQVKTTSILDYGCGKGMLAKQLPFPIWEYDPAIPEKSALPKPADIVICTDVLEHIEQDKIEFVLQDLKRCTKQIGYFVISTRKAVKTYSNGQNAHLIVQDKAWWDKILAKYFKIGTSIHKDKECELHVVVAPKGIAGHEDVLSVEKDGYKYKFHAPNDTTKWRANTLFTKEPSTVEWIEQMKPGEVLWDIGANIGSYSVMAGVRGIKVYAFEPEASNFALLIKNLNLNKIEPNAYCMAISDKPSFSTLYAGQNDVGGACHSFGEQVGPDLLSRNAVFSQGCFGYPLDMIDLPAPDYIKIDVDGFEHKVIKGSKNLLKTVKSILIEINTNLKEHKEIVKYLLKDGFTIDQAQVDRATRKDGNFKGCAEYIFTRPQDEDVMDHLCKQIKDSVLHTDPFPYMVIEDALPTDYYNKLLESMPSDYFPIEQTRGTKGYPKRFTAPLEGSTSIFAKLSKQMLNGKLEKAVKDKLGITANVVQDVLLIRDKPGYRITPHTDTTIKVATGLLYLTDKEIPEAGTNIYVPKNKKFKCEQGKHYKFEDFETKVSVSYKPNTLLLFLRTDNSFHGVEPSDNERNVLLYNLRTK